MKTEVFLAALAVALPTITAPVGIVLSQSNYSKLQARLAQVESRLDALIRALEQRFHAGIMQVIGKLTELEVRVTRLEEKQSR